MFTPEEIKNFVENNPRLVVRKESTKHKGLFVLMKNRFVDNSELKKLWDFAEYEYYKP